MEGVVMDLGALQYRGNVEGAYTGMLNGEDGHDVHSNHTWQRRRTRKQHHW